MAVIYKAGSSGSAVKDIQKLLNKQLKPSPGLDEDGKFGPATVTAVKEFQKKNKLKPDGLVGAETLALLKGEKPADPADSAAPARGAKGAAPPKDAHTSRGTFVAAQVKENPVATKILDQIWPYFPKTYRVISAYLSPSDLYWKVNYHWDAMRVWLQYASSSAEVTADEKTMLAALQRSLMSNAPSQDGHFRVNKIGEPADRSPLAKIEERCKTLQKIKATLKAYNSKQHFESRNMQQKQVLKFALNPLALPKQSNHVNGWALDISGNIPDIATIAKGLGATLAFKEETHCHCEFKNGVKLPR
jgi:lysozyme family protein